MTNPIVAEYALTRLSQLGIDRIFGVPAVNGVMGSKAHRLPASLVISELHGGMPVLAKPVAGRQCDSSRHEDAIGHARVQMRVVVGRRAETVQEGDAAEPRAGGSR